jgi:hypothetical protein
MLYNVATQTSKVEDRCTRNGWPVAKTFTDSDSARTTDRPGVNRSPHAGHSMCSKSTCRLSAGEIFFPHFGQTASSYACTFARLIFRATATYDWNR